MRGVLADEDRVIEVDGPLRRRGDVAQPRFKHRGRAGAELAVAHRLDRVVMPVGAADVEHPRAVFGAGIRAGSAENPVAFFCGHPLHQLKQRML